MASPMRTQPSTGMTSPASTPSSVDLPAPLEPMTVVKEPSLMVSETPDSAFFSSGVPRPKTTWMLSREIMRRALPA